MTDKSLKKDEGKIVSKLEELDRYVDNGYESTKQDVNITLQSEINTQKEKKKYDEIFDTYSFKDDSARDFVGDYLENIWNLNTVDQNKKFDKNIITSDKIKLKFKEIDDEIFFKFDSLRDHVLDTLDEMYSKPNQDPALEQTTLSESNKEQFEEILEDHRFENGLTEDYTKDWLYKIPDKLSDDYQFVLDTVKKHGRAIFWASSKLKNNKKIILEAIKKDTSVLNYLSEKHKKDPDIMAVVNKNK